MYWTLPGTHEVIDLDRFAVDPDWDSDDILDEIIAAAAAARDDGCGIE